MNDHSKARSTIYFVLALFLLFGSLHSLSSALTYNEQQSFVSPALTYDMEKNEFLATNLEIPFLILFTLFFGLGWWCESFLEGFLLSNNRTMALVLFYTPFLIYFLFIVGMAQFPQGFLNFALAACGFVVVSGFYLRYSTMSSEVSAKLSKPNQ